MQTYWFEARNPQRTARRMSASTAFHEFASTQLTLDISTHTHAQLNTRPELGSRPQRELLRHQNSLLWGSSGKFGSIDSLAPPSLSRQSSDATARLIDWNTDVLLRLLKQVVAKREVVEQSIFPGRRMSTISTDTLVSQQEQLVFLKDKRNGSTVVDEVKEIISLPEISCGNGESIDPDSVVLGNAVEKQLRDYVHCIASSYRSNPFHNYEHVSIVAGDSQKRSRPTPS